MNCPEIDIKGYFLDELTSAERAGADRHLRECGTCAEELDRLRITESALRGIAMEEPPRRLVFASERAPEPKSWWAGLWESGPRLGFASAAMLSCAILVHGVTRPAAAPAPVSPAPTVDVAAIESRLSETFDRKLAAGIADAEKRADQRAAKLVAANEQKLANEYRAEVVALASQVEWLTKKMNVMRVASNYEGRP